MSQNINLNENSNSHHSLYTIQQISSMSISSILHTYLKIIQIILNYNSELKIEYPSTIFDINKQNNIDTDSDSESEDNSILEKIDIENFIIRCIELLEIDNETLILSMIALDKLLKKNFLLNENNIHKVIFICIMETHKYYNDNCYISNSDYAKVCGISINELLKMELEFMNIIDFNMFINEDEFNKYWNNIKKFRLNILF